MYKYLIFTLFVSFVLFSCSPIKSSSKEEGVQMELSLHEVQTNLDDLKHDITSLQTELQILHGKIKYQENSMESLKQQTLDKVEGKLDLLIKQISNLEKRENVQEKELEKALSDMRKLGGHTSEESSALVQYRERLRELEKNIIAQSKRLDDISKLKGTLDNIAKSIGTKGNSSLYKVKGGDSLEKIAKNYSCSVELLKQLNNLSNDRIVVGQELRIPE